MDFSLVSAPKVIIMFDPLFLLNYLSYFINFLVAYLFCSSYAIRKSFNFCTGTYPQLFLSLHVPIPES